MTTPERSNIPEWFQDICTDFSAVNEVANEGTRGVLTQSDRLWENGKVLTFGFTHGSGIQPIQILKVMAGMKEWEKYANVHFVMTDPDEALIRISLDPQGGSWSWVGNEIEIIPLDQPTMNLGWVGLRFELTNEEKRAILHEIGHTLGMKHEHQSLSRGGILTLNRDAVIEYYRATNSWPVEKIEQHVLRLFNEEEISNFTELDLNSIMMYYMPAQLNEQHKEIKQNYELSDLDKAFIRVHYPTFSSDSSQDGITFARALDVLHIQGADKEKMLKHYNDSDWRNIREIFHTIYVRIREERNKIIAEEVFGKN